MAGDEDASRNGDEVAARLERMAPADQKRLEQLIKFSDLCTSARQIAVALDETFLTYMISMSIQAARLEMQPKPAARPKA